MGFRVGFPYLQSQSNFQLTNQEVSFFQNMKNNLETQLYNLHWKLPIFELSYMENKGKTASQKH